MGDKQLTQIHPFLDPKLAVESIGEVPRVPRAHLEVEFAQTIVRFSPPLYRQGTVLARIRSNFIFTLYYTPRTVLSTEPV